MFLVIGSLLHLSIRDSVWPLSVLYYSLPAAIIVVCAAVGWFASTRSRKAGWGVVVLASMSWWYLAELHTGAIVEERPPAELRFGMWNIFQGSRGYDRVLDSIKATDVDVLIAIEPRSKGIDSLCFWNEEMPEYKSQRVAYDFAVVSRLPVKIHHLPKSVTRRINHLTVEHPAGPIEVVMLHPVSTPWLDRRPFFETVKTVLAGLKAEGKTRIIVCGDFNTPVGSALLDPLRSDFEVAHEQPGGPYQPTWPSVFPVLTLDQVWYGEGLEIAGNGCQHLPTTASDHMPVVVEFASKAK